MTLVGHTVLFKVLRIIFMFKKKKYKYGLTYYVCGGLSVTHMAVILGKEKLLSTKTVNSTTLTLEMYSILL